MPLRIVINLPSRCKAPYPENQYLPSSGTRTESEETQPPLKKIRLKLNLPAPPQPQDSVASSPATLSNGSQTSSPAPSSSELRPFKRVRHRYNPPARRLARRDSMVSGIPAIPAPHIHHSIPVWSAPQSRPKVSSPTTASPNRNSEGMQVLERAVARWENQQARLDARMEPTPQPRQERAGKRTRKPKPGIYHGPHGDCTERSTHMCD